MSVRVASGCLAWRPLVGARVVVGLAIARVVAVVLFGQLSVWDSAAASPWSKRYSSVGQSLRAMSALGGRNITGRERGGVNRGVQVLEVDALGLGVQRVPMDHIGQFDGQLL